MHALGLLTSRPNDTLTCRAIAMEFRVSEAHLSKVLQRLVKAGLLVSARGPKGGFSLAREPASVSLIEVFEAIEGPIKPVECFFSEPICEGGSCALGKVIADVNRTFYEYLSERNLEDISTVFEGRRFGTVRIDIDVSG